MENLHQLIIAVIGASFIMLTLTSLRVIMRAPSAPAWLSSEVTAQIASLLSTIGIAVSCAYLGFALAAFMAAGVAIVVSIALHAVIMVLCHALLIRKGEQRDGKVEPSAMQGA